jgi:putative DNA methylase
VTERRKLIEVALPLEAINRESAREKSIRHGHPSTLHLWWARRPLAACRAVIFASLVDDPSSHPERFPTTDAQEAERRRLFEIIERLVKWDNTTNEAVLEEARAEIRNSTAGSPPPLLDPFCGGGSIPLEAQRLGLEAYASDLNPVAVLITKALIEIPPRFVGNSPVHPDARRGIGSTGTWKGPAGLAEDVRRYGTWLRDEAERRIGNFYPKVGLAKEHGGGEAVVIAWLWARTVVCPNPACRTLMPLVSSFALSTKKGQEARVEPIVDRTAKTVRFEVRTGPGSTAQPPKVGRGSNFRCLVCNQVASETHIKAEGRAGRMDSQLLAIVAEGQRGRVYVAPTADHEAIARSAIPEWEPTEPIAVNPRDIRSQLYGMNTFADLFTRRQLLALTTFSDLVREVRERVLRDAVAAGLPEDESRLIDGGSGAAAYADAVATYLAFAVDKASNRNCTLCIWEVGMGRLVAGFGRQALAMTWDFAETNPLAGAGGDIRGTAESVAEVIDRLAVGPMGYSTQRDAALDRFSVGRAAVATDPPYYDNIAYADLSDFFYVWLRRAVGSIYPDLFGTLVTPKSAELVASPHRFDGNKAKADAHFEEGLHAAFERMREIADPSVPTSIYYAFKQAESDGEGTDGALVSTGWETMLEGLLNSGFAVGGTWPIRTEQGSGLRVIGQNALASSIVLVCRPRSVDAGITTRKDFVAALRRELPEALRTLQHGNIAPVDLAQSSIGPGMAIYSRHAKVLEPDGSAMRIRTALGLINQVLDQILAEQEGEFDPDTRWAITWFEQHGMSEGRFGDAETLSKAKDTAVAGLERAGIIRSGGGKVRLLRRDELGKGWNPATDRRPTVWEATQHLARALEGEGEAGAAQLAARIGGYADLARDLAYRLYLICDRMSWADEAFAYNQLVVAWPEVDRLAQAARSGARQQTLSI